MAFEKICTLDDVWEGEMGAFETSGGTDVLIVYPAGGDLIACQSICPHQEFELIEGTLEDHVLTCRAHLWQFDVRDGNGINPSGCKLAIYPTKIDGDDVCVDIDGIKPSQSHP
jgi:toluene monooxygenase system ferredoxin subunit